MKDIIIKKSEIEQFDKGIFADRNFKKREKITTNSEKDDF